MDMKRLNAREMKILRRVYGPAVEHEMWIRNCGSYTKI
jgi:hypothetical protein